MINEIKSLMKNKLKEKDNKFFSNSKTSYIRLHIEYNCFIMSVNNYTRREIQTFVNEKYKNYEDLLIQNKKSFDEFNEVPKIHMYEQSVSRVVSRCRKRLINFSENRIFP